MNWGNLESGLLGAIAGGLLGSLVSYFGAFWLQRNDDREKQRAAGRALLAEIVKNYESLKYVGDHKPAGYSEQVWQSQLPLIAQSLTWRELRIIAEPYLIAAEPLFGFDLADELERRAEARISTGIQTADFRPIEKMRKKCQEDLAKARNGFAAAANLLRGKLLTLEERTEFPDLPAVP
jgi:hypothetical protein